MDQRVKALANILVNYSIQVQTGDWVLVQGDVLALPLIEEVVAQALRAGGNPTVVMNTDQLQEIRLRESSETQLAWISPAEELLVDRMDARIAIRAPSNTRFLSGIDPQKQKLQYQARRKLMKKIFTRSSEGSLRWVGTQYPCPALAQEGDMSVREFEDFVYRATFADQDDPIQCWQDFRERQQRLVDWLEGKEQVIVRSPNIDLTFSVAGRQFLSADGSRNMPDGEIFTGPVEDSVNGWVKFTYPGIRDGREVEGVEFVFENGKVVQARAKKNEAYLLSQLDSDEGARYLGEFAIGTNDNIQRFTKSTLYDEKIVGTVHMAVGAGYPETGSLNQSSIHWDFICDMRTDSEILIDGDLFYQDGDFQI